MCLNGFSEFYCFARGAILSVGALAGNEPEHVCRVHKAKKKKTFLHFLVSFTASLGVRSCLLGRSQEMSQNMYVAYTRQKKEKTFLHFLGHAVNVILTPIVVNNLAKLFLGKKNEFIVYLTLSSVIANANDRMQEEKKSTNRAKGSMHSSFVGRLQKLCCPGKKKRMWWHWHSGFSNRWMCCPVLS